MNYDLKPKEYQIMKFIWSHASTGVTFSEIHNYINSLGKQQSRQRVNCYIQSLISKEVLSAVGEDRHKIYTPKISKECYDKALANNILNQLFDGSLKNFICALSGGNHITEKKADELRKLLTDIKKQN